MTTTARWDLTNVYPSLDSPEFAAAFVSLQTQTAALETFFAAELAVADATTAAAELGRLLGAAIDRLNALLALAGTLRSYISGFVTTDSRNKVAARKQSEFEQAAVRIEQLSVRFKRWVGALEPALEAAIAQNPTAQAHAFMLRETAAQARYLMGPAEEALAAEFSLSGGRAWGKLQAVVPPNSPWTSSWMAGATPAHAGAHQSPFSPRRRCAAARLRSRTPGLGHRERTAGCLSQRGQRGGNHPQPPPGTHRRTP